MQNTAKHFLSTRRLTILGMMTAIVVLLSYTPLGFIPLGPVSATIIHIPVLICLMVEGLGSGVIMGLVFGLVSMLRAYTMPSSPVDIVFLDPLVAVLPRVLIPLTAYLTLKLFVPLMHGEKRTRYIGWGASAFVGTFTNTAGVLGMIYLLHGAQYAELVGIEQSLLGGILLGVAGVNGTIEAALAMVLVPAIMVVVTQVYKRLS